MSQYRCYFIDLENHVTSRAVVDLATDGLAVAEADKLWRSSISHGLEVWSGAQLIHREVKPVQVAARAAPE
jgi:hypothetical protein